YLVSCIRVRSAHGNSFDHLVGAGEHCRRHVEAKRLRRLEVDGQPVLGRRLYRKVGRLLAFENAIHVSRRAPVHVDNIRAIGGPTPGGNVIRVGIDSGQSGRAASVIISSRRVPPPAPVRIKPPFGASAKSVTACSISLGSRSSIGLTSTPNNGATA